MHLLDTNIVSELRKLGDNRCDPGVAEWIRSQREETLFLSVVTLLEIGIGIKRLLRRDKIQAEMLTEWFERHVIPGFEDRILGIDAACALRCANLHVPDPRPERDAWIAAIALENSLTVVTRNQKDFEPMAVPTINPFSGES